MARSPDPATLVASHFRAVRAGYNSREIAQKSDEYGRPVRTETADGKQELWVEGILNIGVRPDVAIQKARAVFESANSQNFVYEVTTPRSTLQLIILSAHQPNTVIISSSFANLRAVE